MAQGGSAEVFGGYTYFRANVLEGANLDGWNVSATGRINDWLGIVGDFGGQYGSPNAFVFGPARNLDTSVHSFLFGPRLYANYSGISPYVHALFGAARSSAVTPIGTVSDAAFAMALGGGVDLKMNRSFAIRLFQVDYFPTRFFEDRQDNARISTGIVLRFRVE
jgi:hypothetical protein